jgi:hypothetical protein
MSIAASTGQTGTIAGRGKPSSAFSCEVAAAAAILLEQCADFLSGVSREAYVGESRMIRGGTIGKHVRHTLDHFLACLEGAEPGRVIDYDHRRRLVPMESDASEALRAIDGLRARLACVGDEGLRTPVRVRVMLSSDGTYAELASTLGRELAFAAHHAVHHHAMMGAIATELAVPMPPDFGKAPSTIRHDRGGR